LIVGHFLERFLGRTLGKRHQKSFMPHRATEHRTGRHAISDNQNLKYFIIVTGT